MKRLLTAILITLILIMPLSCAVKTRAAINLDSTKITSLDFKKTQISESGSRSYVQKTITDSDDIKQIADWVAKLKLTKHEAIEVPVEKVDYVIVIKSKMEHRIVFLDGYVVYDNTAYTYDKPTQQSEVAQKYNLINYPQTETTLDLIK